MHAVFIALAVALACVVAPLPLRAHGGAEHVHDEQAKGPLPAADIQGVYIGAGKMLELAIELTGKGEAFLYLTTRATNEPVGGAAVTMPDGIAFTALRKKGVYTAKLEKGPVMPTTVSIRVGDTAEAIPLTIPTYAPIAAPKTMAKASSDELRPWDRRELILAAASLVAGMALGFGLARLSMRAAARGVIVLLLPALFASGADTALAHGGEDHSHGEQGGAEQGGGVGGPVILSKRSQILLGLRTFAARKEKTPELLTAYGHIVAKPQNDAVIVAPQAGFVRGAKDVMPGRRVRRGEVLGTLQAITSIPLESPLDGELLDIGVTFGSRVEAGAKLFRITNTAQLWVDAKLFQAQLASLTEVESISVTIDGHSEAIAARPVNFLTPIDEQTRTAKVMLELVDTPAGVRLGSFVRIHFSLRAEREGMPIPAEAVLSRAGDRVVFVKTGPETFEERQVVAEESPAAGTLVVTHGLGEGELVVTTGSYQLLMKAK